MKRLKFWKSLTFLLFFRFFWELTLAIIKVYARIKVVIRDDDFPRLILTSDKFSLGGFAAISVRSGIYTTGIDGWGKERLFGETVPVSELKRRINSV